MLPKNELLWIYGGETLVGGGGGVHGQPPSKLPNLSGGEPVMLCSV